MTAIETRAPVFLTPLLALAGAAAVANLYYAQPLLGEISRSLGMAPAAAGLSMTVTQIGYGLGMLVLVPLGDRFENRRVMASAFGVLAAALLCAGLARSAPVFLLAAFCSGVSASVVQLIVPFASALAAPEAKGRAVGNVMSGLMLGTMMARPLASFVADGYGWRAIFLLSAAFVAVAGLAFARFVPERRPTGGFRYRHLLPSMGALWRQNPALRRRAFIQFFLFGAFTVFWTAVPMLLMGPPYDLTQSGVAWFALIGVTGVIAAPLVGFAADRGHGRLGSLLALAAVIATFLCALPGLQGGYLGIGALLLAATLIDCGVSGALIISQRAVLAVGGDARSRLNGLFFFIFYSGGAVGSALGAFAFVQGGWIAACALGLAMGSAAGVLHATAPRSSAA